MRGVEIVMGGGAIRAAWNARVSRAVGAVCVFASRANCAAFCICFGALVWAAPPLPAAAARGTAAEAADTSPSPKPDWKSYEIIVKRNVFDPARAPEERARPVAPTPTPAPEILDLTGVIVQPSGAVALFEGSKSGGSKAVREGQEVEGLRLDRVRTEAVLASDGPTSLTLRVGVRLSRPPGGSWSAGTRPIVTAAPTPAPTASSSGRRSSSSDRGSSSSGRGSSSSDRGPSSSGRSGSSSERPAPPPSATQASNEAPPPAGGNLEGMSLLERLRERRRRELGQ